MQANSIVAHKVDTCWFSFEIVNLCVDGISGDYIYWNVYTKKTNLNGFGWQKWLGCLLLLHIFMVRYWMPNGNIISSIGKFPRMLSCWEVTFCSTTVKIWHYKEKSVQITMQFHYDVYCSSVFSFSNILLFFFFFRFFLFGKFYPEKWRYVLRTIFIDFFLSICLILFQFVSFIQIPN